MRLIRRNQKRVIILSFVSVFLFVTTLPINALYYSDVPSNHYAYDAISYVTNKGILATSGTTFNPSGDVSRVLMVKTLCEFMNESPSNNVDIPFTDVPYIYRGYVAWAYEKGITSGTSSTTFSPFEPVNRQQACLMIAQMYIYYNMYFHQLRGRPSFTDDADISSWARSAVYALYQNKIVDGGTNGYFYPKDNISKAQLCVILCSLYEKFFFLSVTPVDQGDKGWCWAAAATMTGSYGVNDPPVSLESVVRAIKGKLVDEGGDNEEIIDAIAYASNNTKSYTHSNNPLNFPLSLKHIRDEYEPIISEGPEIDEPYDHHVLVIIGYSWENQYIYYIDSNHAVYERSDYDEFKNGSSTGYRWNETFHIPGY